MPKCYGDFGISGLPSVQDNQLFPPMDHFACIQGFLVFIMFVKKLFKTFATELSFARTSFSNKINFSFAMELL